MNFKFWQKYCYSKLERNLPKVQHPLPIFSPAIVHKIDLGTFNQVCDNFLVDYHKVSVRSSTSEQAVKEAKGESLGYKFTTFMTGLQD